MSLDQEQLARALEGLPAWKVAGNALERIFTFSSFAEAMQFVNRVAKAAESVDHHPDILVSYRRVTLRLTSHDAGGITSRDLRLAARVDALSPGASA